MKRAVPSLLLLLLLLACTKPTPVDREAPAAPSASASTRRPAASASPAAIRVVVADDATDALSLIRTERLKAKADHRVLVVYAGAGWCEPCRRFKREIETGTLDAKLSRVTLLVFDADRDKERLGAAGYRFAFIPYVALPSPDGTPADTDEARGQGSDAWRALLGKLETWQSPPP